MDPLLVASYRLWEATDALDRQRGDTFASDWAARHVCDLIREEIEDPARVEALAAVLEARLTRGAS